MSHSDHQPVPGSSTAVGQGLARIRPSLVWGLVTLVALGGVAGWIAALARGNGLDWLVRLSGAGQISLVLLFPAVAALLWAAAGRPALEMRVPAVLLTVLVVLDVLAGVGFSAWGIARGQWDLPAVANAAVGLLAKVGCALVAARVATASPVQDHRTSPEIETPRQPEVLKAEASRQQPTWQPHQASGGAWLRAGDAATGASATAWGTPPEVPAIEAGATGARPAPQWVPQSTPPRPPQE